MGIPSNLALMILREHKHRPISGKLLSIGRQTVYLSPEQAIGLAKRECGEIREGHFIEIDAETMQAQQKQYITDRSFYSLFSDAQYSSLDVNDYEGAEIALDLCDPISETLEGQYDFIFNGSCLDNIFDPATAIKNMSRLLKHDGRVMHIERASRVHHAYVAFSLSWFHDYYALNQFEDCKVYLSLWDETLEGPWDIYQYDPLVDFNGRIEYIGQDQHYSPLRQSHTIVIAEKGAKSTWARNPVQFNFRPKDHMEQASIYMKSAVRFQTSRRPVFASDGYISPNHPQYRFCGSVKVL